MAREGTAELPGGAVTFLLTDIEGSTTRWERQPEAMALALARHVVKTMGEAFHAVFHDPSDAVAAALDGQRWLQAEPWDQIGGLRVRMALHTGVSEERDGDYYGTAMNRVARLFDGRLGGCPRWTQAPGAVSRATGAARGAADPAPDMEMAPRSAFGQDAEGPQKSV